MEIGHIIKMALKKKRMRQLELAEMLGVGISAVSSWVTNKAYPPGDKLIKIINILDIQDEIFPRKKNVLQETICETEEKYTAIEKLQCAEKRVEEDIQILKEVVQKIAKHVNLDIHIGKNNKVYFDGNMFNGKTGD